MKTNGYITLNKGGAKLLPKKTMAKKVITFKDDRVKYEYIGFGKVKGLKEKDKVHIFSKTLKDEEEKRVVSNGRGIGSTIVKSRFKIGDVLWIREPAKINTITFNDTVIVEYSNREFSKQIAIRKEHLKNPPNWYVVDNFIPNGCLKEMARYFIKITSVRVKRLQDISDNELRKEGMGKLRTICSEVNDFDETLTDRKLFMIIWDLTAQKGYKWEDNPFVFVYEWEYVK